MAIIRAPGGKKYDTIRRVFLDETIDRPVSRPPISRFTYLNQSTRSHRNVWQRMNYFVTDIGDWIDNHSENFINKLLLFFCGIGIVGLILWVIYLWISSGFWEAIITAVIAGAVTYFVGIYIAIILGMILHLVFIIPRYIFYNIYTLLITVFLTTGICFSDHIFKFIEKNNATIVMPPTVLQPNYYCSVNSILKIREYPQANAKVVGQLKKNEEVYVYSIENNFAKIDFKGRIAYASANYLKPIGELTSINSGTQLTNRNETKETPSKISNRNISAVINHIWEEHNVFQDQQKGMRIHVKFNTFNMQNVQGKCMAYFYYKNGVALKDDNNSYRSLDGRVVVERYFKPVYKEALYKDFALFIPYDELHLPSVGKTDLKTHVVLQTLSTMTQTQSQKLTTSDWIYFWYGKLE